MAGGLKAAPRLHIVAPRPGGGQKTQVLAALRGRIEGIERPRLSGERSRIKLALPTACPRQGDLILLAELTTAPRGRERHVQGCRAEKAAGDCKADIHDLHVKIGQQPAKRNCLGIHIQKSHFFVDTPPEKT